MNMSYILDLHTLTFDDAVRPTQKLTRCDACKSHSMLTTIPHACAIVSANSYRKAHTRSVCLHRTDLSWAYLCSFHVSTAQHMALQCGTTGIAMGLQLSNHQLIITHLSPVAATYVGHLRGSSAYLWHASNALATNNNSTTTTIKLQTNTIARFRSRRLEIIDDQLLRYGVLTQQIIYTWIVRQTIAQSMKIRINTRQGVPLEIVLNAHSKRKTPRP